MILRWIIDASTGIRLKMNIWFAVSNWLKINKIVLNIIIKLKLINFMNLFLKFTINKSIKGTSKNWINLKSKKILFRFNWSIKLTYAEPSLASLPSPIVRGNNIYW